MAANRAQVVYVPHRDATAQAEAAILADVYAFMRNVARRSEKAAGVSSTNGNDTKGRSVDDFRADKASLPQ